MKLRLANSKDFKIFNDMYTRFVGECTLKSMPKKIYEDYVDKGAIYFAVEKDIVVGYAIVWAYKDGTAEISHFYVTEKRKGYGTKFYKMLELEIREKNLDTVSLYCFWHEAELFWKQMGYRSAGDEKFYKKLQ